MPQLNKTNARTLKLMLDRRAMQRVLAIALNEWLRRTIEEPEKFEAMSETITKFITAENKGVAPDYGTRSARYVAQILWDLTAPKHAPKASFKTSHRKTTRKAATKKKAPRRAR